MPELPEVETVRRSLEERLLGLQIKKITINHHSVIAAPEVPAFQENLLEQTFLQVGRRGKYLIFDLTSNWKMVVHLRMTGRLVYGDAGMPLLKHTHVIFSLDNGAELRFTDPRRFGRIWLVPAQDIALISGLSTLGPEPLGGEFSPEVFQEQLHRRKTKIKSLLLDQRFIAGIGNIYADEILFRSCIHPERSADSLSDEEIKCLFQSVIDILQEAVEHRGTSFSDYVDGLGAKGTHQNYVKVYQRAGNNCLRCGGVIERMKIGSRSAYYCPQCQK
ncbi:DNA-formamidopyrimidine glycosylase [Dehalobacterium formicoaceticum]|uniref:Formamidopyrimidine-DNA glycosylase n=1 Tax=Dehalobacterium formicoaceticum TaxID=51515 RepID=A0ABT1Y5Y1_9FIRM|nr:DNA-formamidopyrimidine glycosylase [Dehalobacterium formicoaceticum]MCR6546289.1 DNA-formamidopyrimidine glycosylase [Dehalobacterium formicoaceticum]